jgi:hypothetical protein
MMDAATYCSETHMLIEAPREPDPAHLDFYRWLIETGRLKRERDDTGSE